MSEVELLEAEYQSVTVYPGSVPRLGHADALRFLDDCERLGLTVLGVEFFKVGESFIQPVDIASFFVAPAGSVPAARARIAGGFPEGATHAEFSVRE